MLRYALGIELLLQTISIFLLFNIKYINIKIKFKKVGMWV